MNILGSYSESAYKDVHQNFYNIILILFIETKIRFQMYQTTFYEIS